MNTTSARLSRKPLTTSARLAAATVVTAAVAVLGGGCAGQSGALPCSTAGLSALPLELASAPGATEAAASLQAWEKLGLGSKDLTLIDVSPAMNQPAGNGTQTLFQELTQTAYRGLGLFPDSTHMGLWSIGGSKSLANPYQELVPLGPLPAKLGLINRRTQLVQINKTMTTSNGRLALHDAILAGYRYMTSTYTPNYANAELVLTAGVDSAPGDMSLNALLNNLRALYNPSRKVEIVIIQFGQQGNFTALREIALATGGIAYKISNPAEVGKIFIEAISHRMCDQGCLTP